MNFLREVRVLKGRTQFELKLATGISTTKISLAENGYVELRPEEKVRLAKALGVDVEYLFPDGLKMADPKREHHA